MPCLKLPLLPRWQHPRQERLSDTISEHSPLLPQHHHHHQHQQQPQPQQPQQPPQTLRTKYGTCTSILHYGTSSSIRLYTTSSSSPTRTLHVVKTLRPTTSTTNSSRRTTSSHTQRTLKNTLESLLSSTLTHPHLLHTLDILPNSQLETCLVSEYCPLGDLGMYISSTTPSSSCCCSSPEGPGRRGIKRGLDSTKANTIFSQLMSAIEYLHALGIGHGDICVENIFLTYDPPIYSESSAEMERNGRIYIYALCLGLSLGIEKFDDLSPPSIRLRRRKRGPYASPETLSPVEREHEDEPEDKEIDPRAADVWAAGIVYLVMRMGRILWRSAVEAEDGRYAEYLRGRRRCEGYGGIEGLGSTQCRNVIYAMLDPDPRRRIRAGEVTRSEWLFGSLDSESPYYYHYHHHHHTP
ncbi:hypothetical protein ASPCADRAFT_516807 [Aspergillus carbonarius ITEM 5010]|uniref:EKC/KEOPS complex subunit BUD32 n=1 Tax=Aspergillus carbonarius (strain ITEM 5010) TaxID=602072 RepID=A0A1R3RH66_ASPC5|nr:hypothetical protein ASPCADRAFT_516807 [Aspergillus carbonarius ITEM 5010]